MTLGGHPAIANHPGIKHAIANVTSLWRLMFGQDAVDNDLSLTSKNSVYTKGFVVYYDLTPGRAIPMPKLYIPVRHYATSDAHVCQVMSQYYRDIGFIKSGSTYQETIERALYVISL
jgi:tryptophan 7-dimethylallyltransferase